MDWSLLDGPICSQRLSPEEAGGFLKGSSARARLADSIADACRSIGEREDAEAWEARARHDRDLAWLMRPGDQIWITIEPQSHPELDRGIIALVVVRDGQIVWRQRVGVA